MAPLSATLQGNQGNKETRVFSSQTSTTHWSQNSGTHSYSVTSPPTFHPSFFPFLFSFSLLDFFIFPIFLSLWNWTELGSFTSVGYARQLPHQILTLFSFLLLGSFFCRHIPSFFLHVPPVSAHVDVASEWSFPDELAQNRIASILHLSPLLPLFSLYNTNMILDIV